jgi:glycosyltransferase involved in cell wall biosynthesis
MSEISVCIISKNEEENIEKCLRAITPLQSEIILTDTGSTDNTVEIAGKYTKNIFHFDWCDDFSAARNYCAARASNDWILFIDCDEYLVLADILRLNAIINEHPLEIGMVNRISPYPGDESNQSRHDFVARLYNRTLYSYKGRIQETIEPINTDLVPMDYDSPKYFEIPLTFYHAGFETINNRRKKAERDLTLLQETLRTEGPTPYTYYQLGKCYVAMKDPALAAHYFYSGISLHPNPVHTYVHDMIESYGFCLLELKQYDKALSLEQYYELLEGRADYVYLMGLIYMNNARYDEAITQFQKAMTIKNYSIEGVNTYAPKYNIGLIYESLGKRDLALEYYRDCGAYGPALKRIAAIN